jgi:predicted TIM-barrel fold metal-dependent hydrolase
MPIDLHAHYVPARLADCLRRRQSPPRIEAISGGTERLHMPVGTLAFTADYVNMDARLAFMDRAGMRRQVLSLPGLFGIDSLPLDDAGPLTRIFNDDVASLCRRHPERFLGLAVLPLANMAAAVSEFRRARSELGLIGAILPVNAFLTLTEADKLRPLLAVAEELGAHVFIHPGRRADEVPRASPAAPPDNALARRALDVQTQIGQAMITLLLSDFLDAYQNVSVHVANLGGTLPAVIERMDNAVRLRAPGDVLPSSRAHRVRVDCASLGPRAIELAVAVYGADKIVLGTDCPIFRADWTLAAIREARLTEDERERILTGNAAALLAHLDGRRSGNKDRSGQTRRV